VTLQSERVVVERRRPVSDKVTGEVLVEMTVEVVETAEVPIVNSGPACEKKSSCGRNAPNGLRR
jgi:hypothetical protein